MSELAANLQGLSARLAGRGQGAPSRATESGQTQGPVDLADFLAVPLDRFACDGQLLEIRVPWLAVTLWFVPDERDADTLGRAGVQRGRVWTATELMAVMALRGRTPSTVLGLARAKYAIDGDLVGAGSPSPERLKWAT